MSEPIVLDATPLSLLCNPNPNKPVVQEINAWLEARVLEYRVIYVPESRTSKCVAN